MLLQKAQVLCCTCCSLLPGFFLSSLESVPVADRDRATHKQTITSNHLIILAVDALQQETHVYTAGPQNPT